MSMNPKSKSTKITILTPVHVGTGRTIEPVCYICKNGIASCYAMEDLLESLPTDKLLDPANLSRLARGTDSKRDFYSVFKSNKLPSAKPLYRLNWYEPETLQSYLMKAKGGRKAGSLEVSEQIKALNTPIIPGSTLKGAIECAFKYNLLKTHYDKVHSHLEEYCQNARGSTPELFYLQLIYGLSAAQARKQYGDFVKDLYGCLQVRDIPFHAMELLAVMRYPYDSRKKEYSCGLAEHIGSGDSTSIEFPFEINAFKVQQLERKYPMDSIQTELVNHFCSKEKLLEAIRTYYADMVNEDDLPDDLNLSGLDQVETAIRKQKNQKSFVMRVGQNTTYFFKTVSRLIQQRDRELFENRTYFENVFSPTKLRGKNAPNPQDFPRTFSFAQTPEDLWPTGFIEIEYADEN